MTKNSEVKTGKPNPSRQQRRQRIIEALEQRTVFAAPTLGPLLDASLLSGAPIQVALNGVDADGDALTFSAVSDNPDIVAELRASTNRTLVLQVDYRDATADEALNGITDDAIDGELVFQLFEDLTPAVTNRIIELVNQGFYDGLIFHRVINNFVIQGGDPLGDGSGGSGVKFDDEYHADLQHTVSGLLSMAKSSDDTNDSQFFITEGPQRNLDFNHSIFGMLVVGEDVRDAISNTPTGSNDKPVRDARIVSALIIQDTANQVLTVKAANGFTGSGMITVTVDDGNGGTKQQTFTVNATPDTNNNRPFLVNPPVQIDASSNGGAVNAQLQSTDVDGGDLAYYAFLEDAADSSKVTVSVDKTTGLLTVTPVNGFSGVANIFVVASSLSDGDHDFIAEQSVTNGISLLEAYKFYSLYYDMQSIPVAVSPAPPTSIDLLEESDTGINGDDITRNDNDGNAAALTFRVTGVTAGTVVQLYDGVTLIGESLAAGETVDITTDGTTVFSAGQHSITARQVLPNQMIDAGNQHRDLDLFSTFSPALDITVDTTGPIFSTTPVTSLVQFATYQYNADTDDEFGNGASYDLTNAPAGMAIDPDTGLVTWLPTQDQINAGTADVTIQATDVAGNVSNQTYTITFVPNEAPTLDAVAEQTVDEGTTFTYALVAQDVNLPGDTLTYTLISGPANAVVNPTTGVVTFTPLETDGGTTKTFTVRVTDAGDLFAEQTFDLVVNDTNTDPSVAAIGTQTVTENQELVVAITASDSDIPVDTLSYELLSGPTGTTIDASGVIRWTPDELFGGTQQTITFHVNDGVGGSTDASFLVNVIEQNQAPVIAVPTFHTVDELQTLTFTATASDDDLPAQALVFGSSNAPAGLSVNPTTGVITWTPTEAQGPGVYTFEITVTDSLGDSDSETVTVSVGEVNLPPVLGELSAPITFPGGTLFAQIPGFDPDLPAQGLFYELDAAPTGVTIDPATGRITWYVPGEADFGINTITVRLTDAAGETVTRDYLIQVLPFNIGSIFGLTSRWTSTVVPNAQDNRPVQAAQVENAARILVDGEVAPVSVLGDNTGNSVTSLLGGLNRLQAVEGPVLVEALKPVVEGGATGAIDETKRNHEESETKSEGNPFGSTSAPDEIPVTPTGFENPQSNWQRRFDWREHLRSAALTETAVADDFELSWVTLAPQLPANFTAEPVADSTNSVNSESQQVVPVEKQPLAANAGLLAVAGLALCPRKTPPVTIPIVNDEVRRKRGPRRNWY